ncbi:putative membrane protein [Francisella philomiragia subsp. philomiragia ATCC 25015]|uniref:hypothetical protein n=1 Tax=Francisella philomiragia TaxID=28110 RepID=UPI0001AF7B09|nr:hypothetical protein [Francisella philomiragia]AJI74220.1 putative membrane protein [Francisella philomiragia subsp. philomiragia ATCC 25015]EET21961.1 predicted protein [Francisella philomiragia subsp. philomiragia ATCC 25015]MBK2238659.1 hypothetical protein [Francisella philomiragia]
MFIGILGLIANSPTASLAGLWLVPYFEINNSLQQQQAIDIIAAFWFALIVLPFIISFLSLKISPKALLIISFFFVFLGYLLLIFSHLIPTSLLYLSMIF